MVTVLFELICAIIIGSMLMVILLKNPFGKVADKKPLTYFFWGFIFIVFGALIDIADYFPELNQYIVIGDTPAKAILGKTVGFTLGHILILFGFWQWHRDIGDRYAEITKPRQCSNADYFQLHGFLAICAYCKSIKDEQGHWRQLEDILSSHTDIEFSHGICASCANKPFEEST